eukprot:CAMPEP_0116070918 /NCGR_PEP_ID=MMETSP0322-20121206/13391_1 /TAXON_ID=163516 /ORGANISM="Leptocylindrus danicus var. apora, Strain B651" /LENGTH=317 /DNA_ID=CAMNT_0003559009 /DNA_START=55 /DNA_END=1008 /DNA_ORIENTATION=-
MTIIRNIIPILIAVIVPTTCGFGGIVDLSTATDIVSANSGSGGGLELVDAAIHQATTTISLEGSQLLASYKSELVMHPLTTKMLTGSTLAVCGDAIAQSRGYDDEGGRYDTKRATSFAAFDAVYRAVQHVSFPVIVQELHGQYIGLFVASLPLFQSGLHALAWDNQSFYGAMEQTLASQLGIVPFFYYPVFYTITAFVQGLSQEQALDRAKETFIPLMKRNLLFWIPVQFVQFQFIDESLQIPFLSVCGLCWTFIISLFAGNAKQGVKDEGENKTLVKNESSLENIEKFNDEMANAINDYKIRQVQCESKESKVSSR